MFASRYFANHYFATVYFPNGGDEEPEPPAVAAIPPNWLTLGIRMSVIIFGFLWGRNG